MILTDPRSDYGHLAGLFTGLSPRTVMRIPRPAPLPDNVKTEATSLRLPAELIDLFDLLAGLTRSTRTAHIRAAMVEYLRRLATDLDDRDPAPPVDEIARAVDLLHRALATLQQQGA